MNAHHLGATTAVRPDATGGVVPCPGGRDAPGGRHHFAATPAAAARRIAACGQPGAGDAHGALHPDGTGHCTGHHRPRTRTTTPAPVPSTTSPAPNPTASTPAPATISPAPAPTGGQ